MRQILPIVLLLTLAACTTASPKQFYRPSGAEQQIEISGRFNQISFEHQVILNGETVITGDLPYNYDDASFSGQYQGRNVTSDCHWKSKADLQCLVKVDDEAAATLTF
jgi:hypothetical protein